MRRTSASFVAPEACWYTLQVGVKSSCSKCPLCVITSNFALYLANRVVFQNARSIDRTTRCRSA